MILFVHCHQTTLVSLKRNIRQIFALIPGALIPGAPIPGTKSGKQDNTSIYPDFGGF